jgi:hypothetical protein
MVIQIVKFESELSEEGVLAVAQERIESFRAQAGLIQKYYVKLAAPNWYGGVYIWDSMESLSAYRESELASSIPAAYKVKGKPQVEVFRSLFPLRELS